MLKNKTIILLSCILFATGYLFAVPAIPVPITVAQPDGSTLTIQMHGDEFFRYITTEDGFLVTQNAAGVWLFATMEADGNIVATTEIAADLSNRTAAKKSFLKSAHNNISQNIDIQNIATQKRQERVAVMQANIRPKSVAVTGNMRALVILVNFSDKNFVVSNPQQAFFNLLNQPNYAANGGTGSARDYFVDNSNGIFTPQFDVAGPYPLPESVEYYGRNPSTNNVVDGTRMQRLVVAACKAAYDSGVNMAQYDSDN
ncbi:MAG: hypothetical protein LBV31_02370, partial [Prevotellaceae bacterium]|nr:hypothetical protein [Prevotellaceae bacterium]